MSENKNTLNVSSVTSGIPDMKVNSNNTDVTYSNPPISYDSSNNKSDGIHQILMRRI